MDKEIKIDPVGLRIWNLCAVYMSPEAGRPHKHPAPWERADEAVYGDVPRVPKGLKEVGNG